MTLKTAAYKNFLILTFFGLGTTGCTFFQNMFGSNTAPTTTDSPETSDPAVTGAQPDTQEGVTSPGTVNATIVTSMGTIRLELNGDRAPRTVNNFISYANAGHYNGTIFHRVIDGFMIQGGGFTPDMNQKPVQAPIPLEANNGLRNDRGTIAMARTMVPDSATSQFFINTVNNDMLNQAPNNDGYAVFGRVTEGMDVVDRIATVPTTTREGHDNVPAENILIESVTVE